jgi:hypothetical protein
MLTKQTVKKKRSKLEMLLGITLILKELMLDFILAFTGFVTKTVEVAKAVIKLAEGIAFIVVFAIMSIVVLYFVWYVGIPVLSTIFGLLL